MSDKNQNDIPKGEDAVDDQDMDNLSQIEKAAFEKIMAEINVADNNEAEAPNNSKVADGDSSAKKRDTTPTDSNEEPTAENSGVTDDIPVSTKTGDDDLSDDQRVALDQIMAEIGGQDTKNSDTEPNLENASPDGAQVSAQQEEIEQTEEKTETEENLSDDQQAALDKIMAEINGDDSKNDPPPEDSPDNTTDQDDDGALTGDQQAALDQIMAEINGDDAKSDTDSEIQSVDDPAPPTDQNGDEDLPEDQQAALDRIMADIQDGNESRPTKPADTQSSKEGDSDTPPETPTSEKPISPATGKQSDDGSDAIEGLSLEEFDDQLSSLLTTAQDGASKSNKKSPSPPKQTASAPDQSLTDINSALKSIVNDSDPDESKEAEIPADDDGSDQQPVEQAPAILEEINADTDDKVANTKPGKRKVVVLLKRVLVGTAVVSACTITAGAAYWGYHNFFGSDQGNPEKVALTETTIPGQKSAPESTTGISRTAETISQPVQAAIDQSTPSIQSDFFGSLKIDISNARLQLETKKDEILDLKRYYQNGIQEERNKLKAHKGAQSSTFKAAFKDRKTELGLRSIQRRMIYNAKLDTPLHHLESALEQLLYLERRTRLFELLNESISGLSLSDLKNEGEELIRNVLKQSNQLSIDKVKVTPPSLKSIWKELNSTASATTTHSAHTDQLGGQDHKISKEICSGHYEHKYLLSALDTQTAACLTKWPGKDLYLNELKYLSPETATYLIQWRGEWLSLNGVKTISADTAKVLAQWPGKRLSLNGVTKLSAEATTYLAQWQGDQLEMIGLTSIGRWENYVTRLFLSEQLRRKLQMQ